jgi:Rieske Fe-S protein
VSVFPIGKRDHVTDGEVTAALTIKRVTSSAYLKVTQGDVFRTSNRQDSSMASSSSDKTRRNFVKLAGSSAALWLLGMHTAGCDSADPLADDQPGPGSSSGIQISGNTITLDLGKSDTSGLAQAGGFLLISSAKTVVINTNGSQIRAFTSVCTHQACDINQFSNDRLMCPCHGSQFNTSGQAVTGPATGSLVEFSVTRNGDQVVITK